MKNRRGVHKKTFIICIFLRMRVVRYVLNDWRAFPLRDQHICKFIGTKESVSTPIGKAWSW